MTPALLKFPLTVNGDEKSLLPWFCWTATVYSWLNMYGTSWNSITSHLYVHFRILSWSLKTGWISTDTESDRNYQSNKLYHLICLKQFSRTYLCVHKSLVHMASMFVERLLWILFLLPFSDLSGSHRHDAAATDHITTAHLGGLQTWDGVYVYTQWTLKR